MDKKDKLPNDVSVLIAEANKFLGKTANAFIEKDINETIADCAYWTFEDDLMNLPDIENVNPKIFEACNYSAVASDYSEPKNYREMLKRSHEER